LVLRECGRQHLYRDIPVEAWIAGAVDLAHAARAKCSRDLVGPEVGADKETQSRWVGDGSERPRGLTSGSGGTARLPRVAGACVDPPAQRTGENSMTTAGASFGFPHDRTCPAGLILV
jgi:hypothetical protein